MKTQFRTSQLSRLIAASLLCTVAASPVYAAQDLTDATAANISVSGENTPNEGKVQAFDNSVGSKWLTFADTGWISYDFEKTVTISAYTLTSGNDAAGRDPKNWQLQGSNNGVDWTTIDNRSNESFNARKQTKSYNTSNSQAFSHIRFNVTANNGASILQLAELEFIGEAGGDTGGGDDKLPLSDSGSLSTGSWKHYGPFSSNGTITATTTGSGDADLYIRNGAQPTTNNYNCQSISPTATESCTGSGNNVFVSVYAYSSTNYSINIKDNIVTDPTWTKPQVDFVDMNPETQGSQLLKRIFPDAAGHMAQRCIDVAKILYRDSSESSRFHKLRFELRAKDAWGNDFVAYKTGQDGSGEMTIAVSTSHLEKLYRDGGNSDAAIRDEIDGILFHEVTHGYNNSPLTTDGYPDGGPYWAYTEGLADGVRINAGFHKTRQPDVNGSRKWLGGYTTTGFFLHYVNEKIDPEFLHKFNAAAKDLGNYSWSFDAAFRATTGRGVEDVWQEYRNFINGGGVLNY
ncbi:MAG: discoidin domain-containing protein [Algicola sp.]|nr:discoidin domain-containing protein [Algicola sp.]